MTVINRQILRLSVPAIVSNITVPLLGLCDTAISGHLGSETYLAAIAVGSVMLNVVFWLFGFLRAGTTGLTAKAYGMGNDVEICRVFSRASGLGFCGGILIIAFQNPIMYGLLDVVHADECVTGYVERYFGICIWGAPAILGVMAISGWFVGMQSTVYPMAMAIIVNVINIGLSFLLVFGLGMGFEGVAFGTVIANWIGFVIAYFFVLRFRRGRRVWCGFGMILTGGGIEKFFTVNANLFFRSACIIMVSLGIASAGARLGALTLAVNVIVMQLFQFFSFFMDGFAFSAEAMVGKYYGRRDILMLRRTVAALLWWTLCVAVVFATAYGIGCVGIAGILTDRNTVIAGINGLRIWIALIPLVSAWAFIYDGFYIGVTETRKMMVATIISTIVFYIIAFIHYEDGGLVTGVSDNRLLWGGFLCYLFMRGLILAVQWGETCRATVSNRDKTESN